MVVPVTDGRQVAAEQSIPVAVLGVRRPPSSSTASAETMFGNWGTTLLVGRGVNGHVGQRRAGRLLGRGDRRPPRSSPSSRSTSARRRIYVVLPWAMAAALVLAPCAQTAGAGILVFAFGGLACSGFFPMTVGYGEATFPNLRRAGRRMAHRRLPGGLRPGRLRWRRAPERHLALSSIFRLAGLLAAVMGVASPLPSPAASTRPSASGPIRRSLILIPPTTHTSKETQCPSITTSSSSGPAPGAEPWPTPLALIGQDGSCSSSGATSCPGRWTTGIPTPCSSTGSTSRRTPGTTRDGTAFQPQVHYFVGGATKLYGAALYRLRPEDFGEIDHVDGVSPAWPLGYDEFEPWYTKAEWLYQVHGTRRRRPDRGPCVRGRIRSRRSATSPPPGDLTTPSPPRGTTRSRLRAASCSTRPIGRGAPASAAPGATAIPAWSTPRPTPRSSPSVPLLDLPNVTLLVNAEVVQLETDPTGRTVTGVVVERDGNRRSVSGRTSWSCPPAPPTAPSSS